MQANAGALYVLMDDSSFLLIPDPLHDNELAAIPHGGVLQGTPHQLTPRVVVAAALASAPADQPASAPL